MDYPYDLGSYVRTVTTETAAVQTVLAPTANPESPNEVNVSQPSAALPLRATAEYEQLKQSAQRPVEQRNHSALGPPRLTGPRFSVQQVWPLFVGLGVRESGGCCLVVDVLKFDRREHPEGAMSTGAIVEDLEVLEQGGTQLDTCFPFLAVEKLGLQPCPKRLDHGIVEGVADGAHRGDEAGLADAFAEDPGGELGGFKWSSQHLDGGGVSWGRCGSGSGRFSCIGGRCPRRGGRRWRGAMTASGSGPRLLVG